MATEGEKHQGQRLDMAHEASRGGAEERGGQRSRSQCRVLSEELAAKVETESDMGGEK